jgi:tetratricopeptide (TPR) repeat protein
MSSFVKAREVVTWGSFDERIIALLKYQGKFEEVEKHLDAIKASGNMDLWFWRSVYYYASMRRFDDAIALAKEMREDPEVTYGDEVLWDMAGWLRKSGDLSQALLTLDQARSLLPPAYYPSLDHQRALIDAIRGRLDQAEYITRRSLTAVSFTYKDDYRLLLARLLLAGGRLDEARVVLEGIKGDSGMTWLEANYVRVQIEDMAGSGVSRETAERLLHLAARTTYNPWLWPSRMAEARAFCALASARLGDKKRAREEIVYALRLDPERADIAYMAAAAYALSGDTNQALDWLDTAVERGHGDLWWAEVDPDLDGLRNTPGFKTVISDWEARLEAMP